MTAGNRKPGLKVSKDFERPATYPPRKASKSRTKKGATPKPRPLLKWGGLSVLVFGSLGLLAGYMYWQSLYRGMPTLPETTALWDANREAAVEFLDRDGNTLAIRGPRYGRAVRLDELPPYVARAFVASEDKRFYQHDGADTQAMLRALWSNATSGRTVSGASTLTQQLVKNLILSPEQTLKRKVQEIRLARQLEEKLNKDEILELYLNRVYFGSGFYGLGAAVRFYFGKDPKDLTLAEASLLATLPKAPSRLALDDNMQGAKQRQAYVLREMVESGFITPQSAQIALDENVTLVEQTETNPQFGYILDAARDRANELLPNLPDDLVIKLTIDASLQTQIVEAIDARLDAESEAAKAGQAAAVLFSRDGDVLALYGGRDYRTNKYNRATQAKRQPGSAFKPFVYAAALETGISPYDIRVDQPITIEAWTPKNFSRAYAGPVTIAEALQDSLNTIAAILGQEAGLDSVIGLTRKFGLREDFKAFPSITLGSQEVTLWSLTRAYGPFMTQGERIDPYLVASIENSRGDVLYAQPEYEAVAVYPRNLSADMTGMLTNVIRAGTGKAAALKGWSVAGKTGTSQSSRDAWFVGYSAKYLGGVWTGNDDDTPMNGVTGGGLPARLWADMMRIAHADQAPISLAGANSLAKLSPDQQAKIGYYRDLGFAFSGLAGQP